MAPRAAGLLCAFAACVVFAVQDGISKHLGTHYPAVFVVMLRYWAFAIFVLALASRAPGGIKAVSQTTRPILQISRGLLLAVQICFSISAFAIVGLAGSHSIFATGPLIVACLSVPILGEKVGWRRWTAIGIGFIGILLIVNPLQADFNWTILIAFAAVSAYSLYAILTRLASRTDTAQTSFFYTGIAGTFGITLIGPFFWASIAPEDWIWMGTLCLTGMAGHFFLIKSLDLADAVVVQPVSYLQSVMVCIIGVFLFGEVMTSNMIVGCSIVIGAGLFTLWREAKSAKKPLVQPRGATE